MRFLRIYWAIVRTIWASPGWYIYLAATFLMMGGQIKHPERVIPAILLLGFVFFSFMGFVFFLLQRAANKMDYKI